MYIIYILYIYYIYITYIYIYIYIYIYKNEKGLRHMLPPRRHCIHYSKIYSGVVE